MSFPLIEFKDIKDAEQETFIEVLTRIKKENPDIRISVSFDHGERWSNPSIKPNSAIIERYDISNIIISNEENIRIKNNGITIDLRHSNVFARSISKSCNTSSNKDCSISFLINPKDVITKPRDHNGNRYGLLCPDCDHSLYVTGEKFFTTSINSKNIRTFNYHTKDSKHIRGNLSNKAYLVLDRENTFNLYCPICGYKVNKEDLEYMDSNIISRYNVNALTRREN